MAYDVGLPILFELALGSSEEVLGDCTDSPLTRVRPHLLSQSMAFGAEPGRIFLAAQAVERVLGGGTLAHHRFNPLVDLAQFLLESADVVSYGAGVRSRKLRLQVVERGARAAYTLELVERGVDSCTQLLAFGMGLDAAVEVVGVLRAGGVQKVGYPMLYLLQVLFALFQTVTRGSQVVLRVCLCARLIGYLLVQFDQVIGDGGGFGVIVGQQIEAGAPH